MKIANSFFYVELFWASFLKTFWKLVPNLVRNFFGKGKNNWLKQTFVSLNVCLWRVVFQFFKCCILLLFVYRVAVFYLFTSIQLKFSFLKHTTYIGGNILYVLQIYVYRMILIRLFFKIMTSNVKQWCSLLVNHLASFSIGNSVYV